MKCNFWRHLDLSKEDTLYSLELISMIVTRYQTHSYPLVVGETNQGMFPSKSVWKTWRDDKGACPTSFERVGLLNTLAWKNKWEGVQLGRGLDAYLYHPKGSFLISLWGQLQPLNMVLDYLVEQFDLEGLLHWFPCTIGGGIPHLEEHWNKGSNNKKHRRYNKQRIEL